MNTHGLSGVFLLADQSFIGGMSNGQAIPKKARDMGDGTFAEVVATVPSASTQAAINQTYTRSVVGASGTGNAILVANVTTAGTVSLTLSGGGTVTINVPLGSSIWPFSTTAATLGTAVGATFNTLYFV